MKIQEFINIETDIKKLDLTWFVNEMKELGYSDNTIFNACFILEEMLVNIICYSNTVNPITLNLKYSHSSIKIRLADDGNRFNPVENCDLGMNKSLKEYSKDRLGIHITKELSDEIIYRRVGRYNILTIKVNAEFKQNSSLEFLKRNSINNTISFHNGNDRDFCKMVNV